MKNHFLISYLIFFVLISSALIMNCNPNNHEPTDHPCNFPNAETENDLRYPFSFKILDFNTLMNLVDTLNSNQIHPDSVRLYDSEWNEIDPEPRYRVDNEWIFDNFPPYINVPVNDPQSLLNLTNITFYLTTQTNDVDTIIVYFNSCLVTNVLFNNTTTEQPLNVPTSASFYFKKKP